tara:strand:- start:361 stop:534 length:174 start_codon:yes stop_codon:yes gene_type:complete
MNYEKLDSYYAYQDGKHNWELNGKKGSIDEYVDVEMKKRGYIKDSYQGHGVWTWIKN